jgi:hypothetical protein
LQTFALEAVIGSMGYNAYLIDFNDYTKPWNRQLRNKTIFSRIKCILFHPQLLVEALKAKIVSKQSTKCSTALIRKFKDADIGERFNMQLDDAFKRYAKKGYLVD